MKIRKITNKIEWDGFVKENSPQAFFQSWNWGEVERENGHKVTRFGIYDDGELVGSAQIIKINAKRGKYFHLRHGPIFKEWKIKYIIKLVDYLKNEVLKKRYSFIRVSPPIGIGQARLFDDIGFIKAPIHNMDAEISFVIDLSKSLDKILARMRKNTRNLVRKALKMKDLKVISGVDNKLRHDFLNIFKETAKREKFVFERGIKKELDIFAKDNQAEILIAYYKGKPEAGALIVYWGNQGIYRYAATSLIGRTIPASYLVQWQAIQNTQKRKLRYYNLWGGISDVNDKTHPWHGLTLFKRGFGGQIREYMHARDLPVFYKYWVTYFFELCIKYIRGYEKIGPWRAPTFIRELFRV